MAGRVGLETTSISISAQRRRTLFVSADETLLSSLSLKKREEYCCRVKLCGERHRETIDTTSPEKTILSRSWVSFMTWELLNWEQRVRLISGGGVFLHSALNPDECGGERCLADADKSFLNLRVNPRRWVTRVSLWDCSWLLFFSFFLSCGNVRKQVWRTESIPNYLTPALIGVDLSGVCEQESRRPRWWNESW